MICATVESHDVVLPFPMLMSASAELAGATLGGSSTATRTSRHGPMVTVNAAFDDHVSTRAAKDFLALNREKFGTTTTVTARPGTAVRMC